MIHNFDCYISSTLIRQFELLQNSSLRELVCLLFGVKNSRNIVIMEIAKVKNVKKSRFRFGIGKKEAYSVIQRSNYQFVGIFHSHYGGPSPSDMDKVSIVKSNVIWLINSLSTKVIEAYLPLNGQVHRINLIIV